MPEKIPEDMNQHQGSEDYQDGRGTKSNVKKRHRV